ncbi:hypothetical protein [Streptomyces griseorubiginosus]|uniref:hypothetical protein n=1 Tax=Streptomyces griseorubiginosus TaxID=67304 RepID=UPI00215B4D22|nr:hypothetical protein [Streptomyces griseorubiginosus]
MDLAVAVGPPDDGEMGKRETPEEAVRRLGREGFGFLTEAGFAGPHEVDGGFSYTGHGLRIKIYHYFWKNEAEVIASVCILGDSSPKTCADLAQLYAECGLGAVNHLPRHADSARLAGLRVRAFGAALEALLPHLLSPHRTTLLRRASTRP